MDTNYEQADQNKELKTGKVDRSVEIFLDEQYFPNFLKHRNLIFFLNVHKKWRKRNLLLLYQLTLKKTHVDKKPKYGELFLFTPV